MKEVKIEMFTPLLRLMRAKLVDSYGASESDATFLIEIIGNSMVQVGTEVLAGKVAPEDSAERLQQVSKERLDAVHEKFAGDSEESKQIRQMLAEYVYNSVRSEQHV